MKRSARSVSSAVFGGCVALTVALAPARASGGIRVRDPQAAPASWSFPGLAPESGGRPADPWIGGWSALFGPMAGVASPSHRAYDGGQDRPDEDAGLSLADLPQVDVFELRMAGDALEPSAASGCELVLDAPSLNKWESDLWIGAPWVNVSHNGHTEKSGEWVEYDQIARRPDRPESYLAYRFPLANPMIVSGYDLDLPDERQRRGKMNATGHGGIDLVEKMGTPITMLRLDHQIGDAEVIYVGWLFGESVVTRHTIREGGRKRDYLLIFGHLKESAEGLRRGMRLREGQLVGLLGNSASPELTHLHLEARRLREGVDAWRVAGWNVNARETSVVTDPRNVLPLRAPIRRAAPKCTPRLLPREKPAWLGAMKLSLDGEGATD